MNSVDELTAALERDYVRMLRWYPRQWRDRHGDALLGTLLDEADAEDRFLLKRGEWRHFATAGIAARLDRTILRPVRDSTTTVLLAVGTGAFLVMFVMTSWAPWNVGQTPTWGFGPFNDASVLLTACWCAAFASAMVNRWHLGRLALLLSIIIAVALQPLQVSFRWTRFFSPDPALLTFSAACAILTLLGTPRVDRRLVTATAGAAVLTGLGYLSLLLLNGALLSPVLYLYGASDASSVVGLAALLIAAFLAIQRVWTPAFTVVLAVLPAIVSLDVASIYVAVQRLAPINVGLLITLNVVALFGVVALVLASRRIVQLPQRDPVERQRTQPLH